MLAEAFLVAHIVRIGMLPLRTRAVILFYVLYQGFCFLFYVSFAANF